MKGIAGQQEKFSPGFAKYAPEIFSKETSQSADLKSKAAKSVQVDKQYYTLLTDALLDKFYPKFCKCSPTDKLTLTDGKRDTVLRCSECHKQQSKLAGTPLNYLKLPRWMFGYLLKEAQLQYPKVLTITEISKRVGVSYPTAMKLKRRLQLFAAETVPRMQRKFYTDNKLKFAGFRFPRDRSLDLTEMVKDKQVPQADTVVLYSCSSAANKGRKRFKRRGQTSSIYMSESLGGKQVGTLVNTMAVKQGPVFYDSVPNQKAETINPILNQYVPLHNPLFTDEGYRGYTGMNHRMVNHSRKSKDKRYKWARNRWSKNGVHCQVAEGRNSVLKRSFSAYGWFNPKYSNLYLQEYSFNSNLRHYALEDLLPAESNPNARPGYQLDDNWAMRGSLRVIMPVDSARLEQRISPLVYEAKSLPEITLLERKGETQLVIDRINRVEDSALVIRLLEEFTRYQTWVNSKPTEDQRRKQRYYQSLAEKVWPYIPTTSYIEIHDLAHKAKISGKHIFRLFGMWTRLGLLDSIDLNRKSNGKIVEYFDIRRNCEVLSPIRYTIKKQDIPQFNIDWRSKLRRIL